jgi:GSH-dependent disulfide-bond oxidoreductase
VHAQAHRPARRDLAGRPRLLTPTIQVHSWEPNANSGKPLFALHEKGVAFTHHYVDMGAREHHEPAYLALNPRGTVPTLVHDGLVLTQSTPMLEYIDAAFPGPPLRPAESLARWRMRAVIRWLDNSVCPALAMVASNRLAAPRFRETAEQDKRAALAKIPDPERRRTWQLLMYDATPEAELAESRRRVADGIARLDDILGKSAWLGGADFSLADVIAIATFHSLPLTQPDAVNPELTPYLWEWLRRCHARPGIRAALGMGRGMFAERAGAARQLLGVA